MLVETIQNRKQAACGYDRNNRNGPRVRQLAGNNIPTRRSGSRETSGSRTLTSSATGILFVASCLGCSARRHTLCVFGTCTPRLFLTCYLHIAPVAITLALSSSCISASHRDGVCASLGGGRRFSILPCGADFLVVSASPCLRPQSFAAFRRFLSVMSWAQFAKQFAAGAGPNGTRISALAALMTS